MIAYEVIHAWCDACGADYRVPSVADDWVCAVMRTSSLLHHATMYFDDPVYQDICARAKSFTALNSLVAVSKVERARFAFGAICEPAPDGTRFSFNMPLSCPKCGVGDFHWGPARTGLPKDLELPAVTHHRWDGMSESERLAELRMWIFHPDNT